MPDPTKKGRRKPDSPKAFIIRSGPKPKTGIWYLTLFPHSLVQETLRKVACNEDGTYGWHHEEQIRDIANSGKNKRSYHARTQRSHSLEQAAPQHVTGKRDGKHPQHRNEDEYQRRNGGRNKREQQEESQQGQYEKTPQSPT